VTEGDLEQISAGILIAAALLVWLLIRVGLADRRTHDKKRGEKKPPD
jgi:hypothetical protein